MERSFSAALSSGDDRSWLPLPSTVKLWGFPRTGSRASSSVAQLNSDSPGKRGWFELCPAMGRGETQPGGRIQPAASATSRGKGRAGMVAIAFGQPPAFFTAFCSRRHHSLPTNECEHRTAAGAACLAFQGLDVLPVVCTDVAIVTMCPHLAFARQQWWSLQSR